MCAPPYIYIYIYIYIYKIREKHIFCNKWPSVLFLIFYFYFLSLFSSIYGNRTVRIRRGKKQSALLDEGYPWEQKNMGFRRSELVKAKGQIDPRIASYAWGTKILDFRQTL